MTPEQYENAARAVHAALQARTSGRRLHIDRYKKHAARVLNMRAVYPARWDEVIAAGRRLGLFKVDRNTLKKPIFVNLCKGTAPAPVEESTFDEDTSDEPTVQNDTQPAQAGQHTHAIMLIRYPKGHSRHGPSGGAWHTVGEAAPAARADHRLDRNTWRSKGADAVIAYFSPGAKR